jgi:hypothetical protein
VRFSIFFSLFTINWRINKISFEVYSWNVPRSVEICMWITIYLASKRCPNCHLLSSQFALLLL